MRVVLFTFWGRRANIELQLPYLARILADNPNVEAHCWDLARNPADSAYIRSITGIDRLHIRTEFYQGNGRASAGQNRVWRHYTRPEYRYCVFVKLDDDDVFIETAAFPSFTQAAVDNPDKVISARTINNGASTRLIPEIWAGFEQLDIPLLDVHLSAEYAELSHRWFINNWHTIIEQPANLVPADTWCSINAITYTWETGRRIAALIGTRPPATIMDRHYPPRNPDGRIIHHKVGDEGAANIIGHLIHTGMIVSHYTFGPQHLPADVDTELRKHYTELAHQYLHRA